jgi:hypothetical protein
MTMHNIPSDTEIAVQRARRITDRALEPNAGPYLDHWLRDSIQRWWMAHRLSVQVSEVREAFADLVEAAIPHLGFSPEMQRLMRNVIEELRPDESYAYASARFLVIELGLDPDATPKSLLLWEWGEAPATCREDDERHAAGYLATLTRNSLFMVADPEMLAEERREVLHCAIGGLRSVALARQHLYDLWSAVTASLCEFGDGDVARTARLYCALDALEEIATDP